MVASPPPNSPKLDQQPERTIGRRYQPLGCLIVAVVLLGGIGSRLAYLQLVEGQRYRQLAAASRIRLMPTLPTRAALLDRSGRVLVDNRPSISAMAWPVAQSPQEWRAILPELARVLGRPESELLARLEQAGWRSPVLVRLARGLPPSQMTTVAELATQVRGLAIQPEAERDYPHGQLAQTILGKVGEVNAAEVDRLEPLQDYRSGDLIGRSGLEAALEAQLRGQSGGEQVELDRNGLPVRVLARKPTEPPTPVRLTLDLPLQQTLEGLINGVSGAAVALDPDNGAVLAMAGQWPNPGQGGNRALKAIRPGALFKWITAVAALESGQMALHQRWRIDRRSRPGGLPWAEFTKVTWPSIVTLNFREALGKLDTQDSDAFFEQVALRLDSTNTIAWARRFGLGQRSGIELAEDEDPGPSLEALWKRESVQARWYLGEGVNLALGRGEMAASPLQIAVMAAVAVNGGYRVQPHLVKDRSAQVSREFLGLQPSTLELLRSALQPRTSSLPAPEVSQPPDRPPQPNVAIGWLATHSLVRQSDQPIGAWAVAAGPANDPKIVVVTFVEPPSDRPLVPADSAAAPSNGAASQEPSAPAAQAAEQIAGATVVNYVQSLDRWLP